MGRRQEILKRVVSASYKHSKLSYSELFQSKYSGEIYDVYKKLNGQLSEFPSRFGSWDISTREFIIELDEERHFNRYRAITLKSKFYLGNNRFSTTNYTNYCKQFENRCFKAASWGNNWKNQSTEKQFGISDEKGVINKLGSSRWKQRAFYDFLKDISSVLINIPVFRLSIYDSFDGDLLNDLLKFENDKKLRKIISKLE